MLMARFQNREFMSSIAIFPESTTRSRPRGGLAKDADTSALNLAARIEDGAKVHVQKKGEASDMTAASATSVTGASGTASGSTGAKINLNSATVEQLDELPGVGESTASAIVEDRESNGPFSSVEDLMRVSGIGEKKFAKMKDRICV